MKKPRQPDNLYFWLQVIKNPNEVKAFEQRGNDKQKQNMYRAVTWEKWQNIQIKKGE